MYYLYDNYAELVIKHRKKEVCRAIIDLCSVDMCKKFSWHINKYGYIKTRIDRKTYYLHRILIDAKNGEICDHINRNTLDNRVHNLRIVSYSESNINSRTQSNNTSGKRGVSYYRKTNKWEAYINKNRKRIKLGYFDNIEDAIEARMEAEKIYFDGFV